MDRDFHFELLTGTYQIARDFILKLLTDIFNDPATSILKYSLILSTGP